MRGPHVREKLLNTINTAISRVISLSPTLQVGISGEQSTKPVWINLGKVDLSKHVEWTSLDDSNYEKSMQERLLIELDREFFKLDSRPGWRVVVMECTASDLVDLLFVWNHPHADGMSGKIFHRLLLKELNMQSLHGPPDFSNSVLEFSDSSAKFPPPINQLAKLPISPSFAMKALWDDYKPSSLFKSPLQADWAPISCSPYRSRFQIFDIGNEILLNVLSACRERKTTLTALLNALVLTSLSIHLEESKARAFACSTAIDQRRFLPPNPPNYPWMKPKETIGNYVSLQYHEFGTELVSQVRSEAIQNNTGGEISTGLLELIWSISKKVRNEIQMRLNMGLKNDLVGLMKFVPDWKAQFKSDVKKPRKLSWFMTNLGTIEEKSEPNLGEGGENAWSIRRAQFTTSTEIPIGALIFSVMSVKNGELVVACTWQDTVLEENLVASVMTDLERWLTQIGGRA